MNNSPLNDFTLDNCASLEPLISAMIDNELSEQETSQLAVHLESCRRCQQTRRDFECINDSLVYESDADFLRPSKSMTVEKESSTTKSWTLTRWLAIATSLLIVAAVAWSAGSSGSSEVTVENIVQPLTDFHLLKQQEQRDQRLMLKTMALKLRSLKLELGQIDPDLATRESLDKKIDDMMHRVSHFESASEL
jgi:hypothetical protein